MSADFHFPLRGVKLSSWHLQLNDIDDKSIKHAKEKKKQSPISVRSSRVSVQPSLLPSLANVRIECFSSMYIY